MPLRSRMEGHQNKQNIIIVLAHSNSIPVQKGLMQESPTIISCNHKLLLHTQQLETDECNLF